MRAQYTFSILRYVHDPVSGEFVNIGVAVFSPATRYLRATVTGNYGRITQMFEKIDGNRFRQIAHFIRDRINALGDEISSGLPFEKDLDIAGLLSRVLPADDSAIQFSKVGVGLSEDLGATLQALFERQVERYAVRGTDDRRTDEDVWRAFRDPMERRQVTARLRPKRIVAPSYEYEFERAWKNEIWHLYEPVSFDMVEGASILDKANRWVGRAASLNDSSEPFTINLLVGAPSDERLRSVYVKATNILNKMPGRRNLIEESEADAFAEDLAREMSHHVTQSK